MATAQKNPLTSPANEGPIVHELPTDRPQGPPHASTTKRIDLRSLGEHASRFLHWWLGELAALLPQRLRRVFDLNGQQIIFEFIGDDVSVSLISKGIKSVLGRSRIDFNDNGISEADLAQRIDSLEKDTDTLLYLQESRALATTLTLPVDALENLREVLGYEIERRTPFKASQVYFDYEITEHLSQSQYLNIRLVVVPRRDIDTAAGFAQKWGFHPSTATIAEQACADIPSGKATPLNFLPAERRWKPSGPWTLVNRLLAVSAICLAIVATMIPLEQRDTVIADLESRIADIKIDAEASQALRGELDHLIPESRFFMDRKQQSIAAIDVLNELSLILPDDTWIQHFQLSGSTMNLQGESAAASELIGLIENSTLFRHATFSTVVARDTRSGRERFQITAGVTVKQTQ